jgi:hypothetical protein
MKRTLRLASPLILALVLLASQLSPAGAQQAIEPAFSSTKIGTFGYQTLEITGNGQGFDLSTTHVTPGMLHVVLKSAENQLSYADFMQVPGGLTQDQATEQALLMAREDVPTEGWIYGGGSYADTGQTVEFLVNLDPGDWSVAASYQAGQEGEEIMNLYPITVSQATPAAMAASPSAIEEPPADVTLELRDTAFGGPGDTVTAGPMLWKVTNTGEQPRQMVLFRTTRELTSEDFTKFFEGFQSGTPPAEWLAAVWVGYTAVVSAGYSTWIELELSPGIYTATSWVVDPETQAPAVLLGMVQSFSVA